MRWAETTCGSRRAELCEEHEICGCGRANGVGQNQRLPAQQLYRCQGVAPALSPFALPRHELEKMDLKLCRFQVRFSSPTLDLQHTTNTPLPTPSNQCLQKHTFASNTTPLQALSHQYYPTTTSTIPPLPVPPCTTPLLTCTPSQVSHCRCSGVAPGAVPAYAQPPPSIDTQHRVHEFTFMNVRTIDDHQPRSVVAPIHVEQTVANVVTTIPAELFGDWELKLDDVWSFHGAEKGLTFMNVS